MVRNTIKNYYRKRVDIMSLLTIQEAVYESHVHAEQLYDRFVIEKSERPDERLCKYSFPMPVVALEYSTDMPMLTLLYVLDHSLAYFFRFPLQ